VEKRTYIEAEDKLVVETIYDAATTVEVNKRRRQMAPKTFTSGGKALVHVASLPQEHLIALENIGYDLMSADPAERRRALVYIQENEPAWLTVNGKPFATFRPKWV
jgi:hypothetical protein